ncbi:unnamed protein product [Auanema sp. JU1783]|nr:unnamed protein product [Auanema sp. JU1783]
MFFSPTLRALRLSGHRVFVLCISNGNFYGQGSIRCRELQKAVQYLGVSSGDVTVLDYEMFQDGQEWDKVYMSSVILRHMETLAVDCVITFDDKGVSGHPNHISCFEALQNAYTIGIIPQDVQIFVLESVPLLRKYIGLFDSPLSVLRSPYRYFAWGRDIIASWRAMCSHRSQLVWFRVLFMIFSRYIYINTLRRINPEVRMPKKKKA